MLDYPPVESWQSVDTFERTSHDAIRSYREQLRIEIDRSTVQSQFWSMLDSFDLLDRSLLQLKSVPDNWNAYGSPAPTEDAINSARAALRSLQSNHLLPKRVLPSAEGGAAIIFVSDNENRAVLEILNDNEASILLYDRRGNSRTLDLGESESTRSESLQRLRDHLRGASLASS